MAEKIYSAAGKTLKLGASAGRGGEATVYHIVGQAERLAKIYARQPQPEYVDKLTWMASHPPGNPTERYGHASLAWPQELLFAERKRLVGYSMPFIQGAVSVLEVFNPRRRAITLPQFDGRYLHRSARNLAAALGALHSEGYVIGDLNESNVLVTPSALVTIIDVDSFQVEEQGPDGVIVHYCPVGKPEYTPPELQGQTLSRVLRRPEHDAFGLAVLIFQLLMDGNHPFRAQWLGKGEPPPLEQRIAMGAFPYALKPSAPVKPPLNAPHLERLHPGLADLMRRCFEDGQNDAQARPAPAEWERAIAAAEAALVACPEKHVYAGHLDACPQCAAEAQRAAAQAAQHAAGRGKKPRAGVKPPNAAPRQRPAAAAPRAQPQPARPTQKTGAGAPAARKPAGSQPGGGWWQRNPRSGSAAASQGGAQAQQANRKPPPAQPPPKSPPPPPQPAQSTHGNNPGKAVGARVVQWVVRSAAQSLPSATAQAGSPGTRGRSFTETFVWNLFRNSPLVAQSGSGTGQGAGAASQPAPQSAATPRPQPSQPSVGAQRSAPASGGQGAAATTRTPAWGGASRPVIIQPRRSPQVWASPRAALLTALKSLTNGSGIGALTGIGAVAGLAVAGGALEFELGWLLLLTLGGAFGALSRGWHPGLRSAEWITVQLGWKRFLQLSGLAFGAVLGLWLTKSVIWLICPSLLALAAGGYLGRLGGRKLWDVGMYWNWERIWAGATTTVVALLGALLLNWLGLGVVGEKLAGLPDLVSTWIPAVGANPVFGWLATGALAGAIGGAVSGFATDLVARVFGLAQ